MRLKEQSLGPERREHLLQGYLVFESVMVTSVTVVKWMDWTAYFALSSAFHPPLEMQLLGSSEATELEAEAAGEVRAM